MPNKDAYYRIVGKDAVQDIATSNLIRNKQPTGIKTGGINLGGRPTG